MKAYLIGLIIMFNITNVYANQTIEQSHQDFYTQVCQRFLECGNHPHVAEMASFSRIKDIKSCMAVITKKDNAQKWKTLLTAKNITHNPKMKSACFAQITTLPCKAIARGVQKPSTIKNCEKFIDGTVEIGANCNEQMECKASDTVCMGTCRKPPLLECGEESCTATQACDSKILRCIAPKKVGQSCTNFSECETSSCTEAGVCGVGDIVSKSGGSCESGFICPLGEECEGKTCKPY